jgi:hypothetical protein
MWTDGRTDMTKLIVVFRYFANAPRKQQYSIECYTQKDIDGIFQIF